MLQEATGFSSQLRRCERAIRSMAAANSEAGNTIKLAMSAPLPARWEETAAGAGGAVGAPSPIGGPGFSGEVGMEKRWPAVDGTLCVSPLTQLRLQQSMLAFVPGAARTWATLPVPQARFQELEDARLEVDSRRRTVADLSRRADGLRAHLGKGGDAKQEAALEATIKRLQHKEGKLQGGLGAPRWPLGCLVGFPYAKPAWLAAATVSSQGLAPFQTCCASQRRRGCCIVHSAIAPSQTICQVAC